MVSTTEVCTNSSMMTTNPSVSTKNHSTRKSLRKFPEALNVKHNTTVCSFGPSKESVRQSKEAMCSGKTFQISVVIQNKPKYHKVHFSFDSTSSSGRAIST